MIKISKNIPRQIYFDIYVNIVSHEKTTINTTSTERTQNLLVIFGTLAYSLVQVSEKESPNEN